MLHSRLLVLGPPRLEQDARTVELSRRKAMALVVYLAITRQPHSRDALATLLWPQSDQSRARADLRRVLSDLHKALGESWLETTGEEVALQTANLWTDVENFRRLLTASQTHGHPLDAPCPICLRTLTQAVSLYRDDFLAGFTLPDSPAFDEWQFFQTESLRGELAHALERLVTSHTLQTNFEAAILFARRWVALDPLLEPPQRALMRLYAATGQHTAALRQYQNYARLLDEELNAAPSAEMLALYERIRRGQPERRSVASAPREDSSALKSEDEIRLGTVLSVGFTEVDRPAEEIADAANTLLRIVRQSAMQYAAQVERFVGDRVQVVFGSPRVHEDDPERAIRAALEIRDAAQKHRLAIAIGISTGQIYFGALGSRDAREVTAIGAVVALASRLQDKAKAGQILVSPSTFRHTQRAFEFAPLALVIGGTAEPITAYAVAQTLPFPEKPRGIEGRRAHLIGRDEELAILKTRFDALLRGQGHIISIIGEAGLGKSRLIAELKQYAIDLWDTGTLFLWLESRSSEWRMGTSYAPFLDLLHNFLYFSTEDEHQRASTLATTLEEMTQQKSLAVTRSEEIGALLGNLLSLRAQNAWGDWLKNASPEQVRHQTFLAIRDFFAALARQQPLVLVFDDLHWADDLSLDLMTLLMDAATSHPILLISAFRPYQAHRDTRLAAIAAQRFPAHYTEIKLRELTPEQSRRLVEALLEIHALPPAIDDLVLKQAWGVPFFVEEALRALIDAGTLYRVEGDWRTRAEPGSIVLPESVQSVILSRVDRLDADSKRVLRAASAIGRTFPVELLAQIAPPGIDLERALWTLEDAALIYREQTVPHVQYSFRHSLTQETVYQTLSRRQAREWHRQVAEALEQRYRDNLSEHYEQLAYHYDRSSADAKAIEYLLNAGEKSRRAYLNDEAIRYFQRVLQRLADAAATAADSTRLAWRLAALTGLGQIHHGLGNEAEAEDYLRQAIQVGGAAGADAQTLIRLYYWLGEALHWRGKYAEQVQLGQEGLARLRDTESESVAAVLMNQTIAVGHLGQNRWDLFRQLTERTSRFIQRLPYSEELRPAYIHIILSAYNDKRMDAATEWLNRLERLAEEHHDLRALAEVLDYRWGYRFESGDFESATALAAQSLDLYRRIGDHFRLWRRLRDTALACVMSGDVAVAHAHADRALEMAQSLGREPLELESRLCLGLIALCEHAWADAEREWRQAASAAPGAKLAWREWVATYCLGRTYLAQDQRDAAREQFQTALTRLAPYSHVPLGWWFNRWPVFAGLLSGLEASFGTGEAFREFCRPFQELATRRTIPACPGQWFLTPAEPSARWQNAVPAPLAHDAWLCVDPLEDCTFALGTVIEIRAANGRDLWYLNHSAPRLLQPMAGDGAAQVVAAPVDAATPAIGGLVLWKDENNFLRLVLGARGAREVSFEGCLAGEEVIVGRGQLPGSAWRIHLRLERAGQSVRALCRAQDTSWFSVGMVTFAARDPVKIGLHAVGWIDRTVHPGAHPNGSAIRFEEFQVWQ